MRSTLFCNLFGYDTAPATSSMGVSRPRSKEERYAYTPHTWVLWYAGGPYNALARPASLLKDLRSGRQCGWPRRVAPGSHGARCRADGGGAAQLHGLPVGGGHGALHGAPGAQGEIRPPHPGRGGPGGADRQISGLEPDVLGP